LFRSFQIPASAVPPVTEVSNTKALGKILYTDYIFAFEIAAVILLVAIVAAIALTLRRRKDSRHQDPGEQVKVMAKDRLRMVRFKDGKPE
ncbi:MAG: NADH-quinone oxidoreductase subunit J, partial [Burkholderiaceae bacterium]|nr:NADH-quinone oxidoreductase subunit J [Burkholderiaceae bacterium]